MYDSAVNFATLGYGDIVMSEPNRFLGPLEAINGALMIGVSTAALLAAFQDAHRRRRRWIVRRRILDNPHPGPHGRRSHATLW